MRVLSFSPLSRFATLAPLVLRLVLGVIMAAHGWQKLVGDGPAAFGRNMLAGLDLPVPVLLGFVVTFVELVGGVALILGVLTRLSALLLTINLIVAIVLVKVDVGLIAGQGGGAGAELDLAIVAGLVSILLLGPGPISLDHVMDTEDNSRRL